MATLNPEALAVTSFETVAPAVLVEQTGDNCLSPLCMTEDKVCTTPWCEQTKAADAIG